MSHMFNMRSYFEVFYSIVKWVMIDVMNKLLMFKFPANMLLHYMAVIKHNLSVYFYLFVVLLIPRSRHLASFFKDYNINEIKMEIA